MSKAKFEPPLGMPTVFDPSFKGVGQKPGLEIWRVEQLKVIKKAPEDKAYQGQIHEGDAYIILQTKMRENALERHIFYWLGKDSSQDEQGVAAYKTVELDMSLGGEPVQHREVQNGESDEFLAIFKKGLRYLEGGVATGFKHVDREAFTTRLLQIKGRRAIRVSQVDLKPESLNSGDVFILDAGRSIFQWNGKGSSQVERVKALEVTKQIRDQERGGNAEIKVLDEGAKDDEADFWKKFGCPKPAKIKSADEGGDDEKHSRGAQASLYRVSNASGKLEVTQIEANPLKREHLDTNDAFILDTGNGLFVWVGKQATNEEKLHSMKLATDFIKSKGYPMTTSVTRVVEGGETPLFKQNFHHFPEKDASKGPSGKADGGRKFEKKSFDSKSMHARAQREIATMPDNGSGKLEIWRVENFELAPWPKERYGEFYGGDSFVMLYTYLVNDKENYIIYFWQGLDSSQDEKGASAIHAKTLDDKYGGAPVQVRVVQNKEPPHFYVLFKGKMVVHAGGKASGFRNRDDQDKYFAEGGVRLFQVRGTNELNTRAIEVPAKAGSLNSGDMFILETGKTLFLWCGGGSSGDEREYAKSISKVITKKEYNLVLEGKEPAEFWEALGGKTEYAQIKESEPDFQPPRLFQCSNNRGYFYVEEVFDFDQEDLIEDDVMILDTYREVFVWIGNGANTEEKKKSLETALQYVKTDTSGRTVEETIFVTVKQGFEPPNFTGHFGAWNPNKWSDGKSYAELKKALNASGAGGAGELTTSIAAELSKFTVSAKYTFEQLSAASLPDGVDSTQKEQYLLDAEFNTRFGMSRAEFNALPAWKRSAAKKKAGLY